MEKKKKYLILGIIILLALVGVTVAYLTWSSDKINIGLNSDCFTIDYTKGQDISGNLKLLNENDLISDGKFTIKDGMGISAVNIGIKSSCNIEGLGSIYLNVTNISDAFTTGDSKGALKYVVLKNTSTITNPTDINTTSLLNQSFDIVAIGNITSNDKKLLYKMELSNTEINKYIIVIYIDNDLAGNSIMSASFAGKISSEAEQKASNYDADFLIKTNEEDGTATIIRYYGNEMNVVVPKVLKKTTNTADVVSNPSDKVISACEDYIINDLGLYDAEGIADYCKNGSNIDGITLERDIETGFLTLSELQQLGKIGSITNLQTSYSSKKYVITAIGNVAFSQNQLTNITIPNTVTSIGSSAFSDNQLTSVIIPDSVTSIGSSAFLNNKLTSVIIPDSVTSIEVRTFFYNQLMDIIIPNTVTTIEEFAFAENKLTNVTIPASVTTIGDSVFEYNNLNYVLIKSSSNLSSIGRGAFSSSNGIDNSYVDNPNLSTIYNNSGKAFDWNNIVSGNTGNSFVTGTTNSITKNGTTYNAVTVTTGQP